MLAHHTQLSVQAFPTLFEAAWVPALPGTHTDRPQSPERLAASTSSGGPGASAAAAPAPRAAGYVPPHQRGPGGGIAGMPAIAVGGGPRPQFSLAFDANDRPGKVAASTAARPASARPQQPPGECVGRSQHMSHVHLGRPSLRRVGKVWIV